MGVKVSMQLLGSAELEQAMKQLRNELGGKEGNITSNALRVVAKDVERRMKAFAPQSARGSHIDWRRSKNGKWIHGGDNGERSEPGRLKRAIFWKRNPRPRYLSELYHVGPRMGNSRNDPNGAWYAAIVNFKGGRGGRGKGYVTRSLNHEMHSKMLQFELARRILPVAKRIGAENAAKVASAAKRANAKFAFHK